MKKHKKQKSNAFTLVELIIVISILALLATIALISFQGYTKSSRDANKLATVTQVEKGLNTWFIQTGKYPEPEGIVQSGNLNGTQLTKVGTIGSQIAGFIRLSKVPTDSVSGNNYSYGVSADNKQFQVAVTLETPLAKNHFVSSTLAQNSYAKVVGNYIYPLKLGNKLYSIPSLIFTGSGELNSAQTSFVVNNGTNIPYALGGTLSNTQTTTQILQNITGTGNLSVTGVTIPALSATEFKNLSSIPAELQALGITSKDQLGQVIYEKEYSTNTTSSSGAVSNTCTSFTYSAWSSCQPDNTQTRTIATSLPNGCTGGTPVLSQSCTYYANAYNQTRAACETETVTVGSYQIASCNVGATVVGTGTSSYGHKFQWGNMYGHEGTAAVTTTTTRTDSTGCTPNNCRNTTFVITAGAPYDWSTTTNNNLWGGDCPNTATPTEECKLKSRGVCPEGFHIPKQAEWASVINTLNPGSNGTILTNGILKLPQAGYRQNSNGSVSFNGANYWASNPVTTVASNIYFDSLNLDYDTNANSQRSSASSVRCFKN